MIRITDLEQKLIVEQIFGESCGDLFMPEGFSEWEGFESQKQEIYQALWDSEQTFWDIYEMSLRGVFSEASPTDFSDIPTKDVPDVARKQVKISKQMAYLGLPQVPKEAAAGLLSNNMISSNPDYYRYIGKGFFGALQDRENGKQPGDYVKEIRYILQGKPNAVIIDRATLKPVPRIGAVTNRPIKQGEPQIPPAWNDYSSKKSNAFQDETGGSYHGVYIGYNNHIKQLETKIGDRIQLTKGRTYKGRDKKTPITQQVLGPDGKPVIGPDGKPKTKIMGYIDRTKDLTTKGYGMGRGEIGADLRPPVMDKSLDPDASSYLGMPSRDGEDEFAIPPGSRGYKPQSSSSSKAIQRQFGQYKWNMMQNPQLYDQRLIRVLLAKQEKDRQDYERFKNKAGYDKQFTPEIPYEIKPLQRNVARQNPYTGMPAGYGVARDYQKVTEPDPNRPGKTRKVLKVNPRDYMRRMWHPDPNMPARQLLASPDKRDMTPEERQARAQEFMKHAADRHAELDDVESEMSQLQKQHKVKGTLYQQDPEWKSLRDERIQIMKSIKAYTHMADMYDRGTKVVPQQVQTGRFGNQRAEYTPEEQEEILNRGTLNGKRVTAKSKSKFIKRGKLLRDEQGDLVQLPTTGAVRRTVLKNNYILSPVPGSPITVSDNLRQLAEQMHQATNKSQRAMAQTNLVQMAQSGTPDDRVYAKYADKYGLKIDKKGNLRITKPRMVSNEAMQTPLSWAKTDEKGELYFVYTKDEEQRDIPLYLPGVIDSRNMGNSTAAGGWDAAPANAPEIRPLRDPEREKRAVHGFANPKTGKLIEGWQNQMTQAANLGVKTGLSELLKEKFSKQSDQFGQSGEKHAMYQALLDAEPEIIQNAHLYFMYNLANNKALEFRQNNSGKIDLQYTKDTFPHLFAACKQFDQWLDKRDDGVRPNRFHMKMKPGMSIFDLSYPELAIVLDRLANFTKEEGTDDYRRLYQTKINKSYIRNGLDRFKATDYVKPAFKGGEVDPNTPKDRTQYDANGQKIDYNYINVGYETLINLFDEARRQYWIFAAKDMVIKMWQHMNSKGSNLAGLYGDSLDAALSGRGSKRRKGRGSASQDTDSGDIGNDTDEGEPEGIEGEDGTVGPTRSRLDGSGGTGPNTKGQQIVGRIGIAQLWQHLTQRYQNIQKIAKQMGEDPNNGSLEIAAQQLALVPAAIKNTIEIDVLDELRNEIKKNGWSEEDKQTNDWFAKEFVKRVEDRLTKQRQQDKVKPTPTSDEPKNITPEEFLSTAEAQGLDQNPIWNSYASKIVNVNKNHELEELMTGFNSKIADLPTREEKNKAETTVAYYIVKDLIAKAPTMSPIDKKKYISLAKSLSGDYMALYDLADLVPKILTQVPDEAASSATTQTPGSTGGGGLRSRIGRKTA